MRKKRLAQGLLQRQVADRLGVETDSLRVVPKIIEFLGYMPFDTSEMTLGERVMTMRHCLGLSREEFAWRLGVDETSLRDWEQGKRRPLKRNREKLNETASLRNAALGIHTKP